MEIEHVVIAVEGEGYIFALLEPPQPILAGMEGNTQFRTGIEPVNAVKEKLPALPTEFGTIVLNQFTGERKIAGTEVQQRRRFDDVQKIEGIGRAPDQPFDFFPGYCRGCPLRAGCGNEIKEYTKGAQGFGWWKSGQRFEPFAVQVLNPLCLWSIDYLEEPFLDGNREVSFLKSMEESGDGCVKSLPFDQLSRRFPLCGRLPRTLVDETAELGKGGGLGTHWTN